MNQMDRAAMPMFSAFTNKPNDTPYDARPQPDPANAWTSPGQPKRKRPKKKRKSRSRGRKRPDARTRPRTRPGSRRSPRPTARSRGPGAPWTGNVADKRLTASTPAADSVNPQQLDRYDWYTAHAWKQALPRRHEDPEARRSPRPQLAGRLPGRRLTQPATHRRRIRRRSRGAPREAGPLAPPARAAGAPGWRPNRAAPQRAHAQTRRGASERAGRPLARGGPRGRRPESPRRAAYGKVRPTSGVWPRIRPLNGPAPKPPRRART